jgi:hypothetical protein
LAFFIFGISPRQSEKSNNRCIDESRRSHGPRHRARRHRGVDDHALRVNRRKVSSLREGMEMISAAVMAQIKL